MAELKKYILNPNVINITVFWELKKLVNQKPSIHWCFSISEAEVYELLYQHAYCSKERGHLFWNTLP